MKKLFLLIFIFCGCSVLKPLQKSKLITLFHLIELSEFEEAKNVVEEMIKDEESMHWYRTWYARGLICQNAYQEGIKKKDKKKYELYPDQLFVAYDSYEKALSLDKRGKLEKQLAPKYVLLANVFQTLGETHFKGKKYADATRAFEQAITISQSPILAVRTDTSLIYNTALAAYENKNLEKAIEYLNKLHNYKYLPNVSHLLSTVYLEKTDTASAERVLKEGIDNFDNNEDLVLLLVDLLYHKNEPERALMVLDTASSKSPSKYIFPYTKGLIYQKMEQYSKAIESYEESIMLAPDELLTYVNIATCYYNIGVEIEENARTITYNKMVLEEKTKSAAAFESAVAWLNKAYEKKPKNQIVITKIYQLYKDLRITEKLESMEKNIN